jgi:S1-C subfamily serine protease
MRRITFLHLLLMAPAGIAQNASEDAFRDAATWTVQIRTSVSRPFAEDELGSWQGAGLVVDARRGWVLTNAHVASRSYSNISVSFRDGDPLPATRLYVDPHLDLAVVAYDASRLERAPPEPTLDCKGSPPVGHPVGAFGHPWGFRFTGTRGITSAVTTRLGPNMLQTDAPINAGNSGGPLISLDTGRVVGVNAAKIADEDVEGISFAVPMPYACTIIALLKRGQDPSPPVRLVDFAVDENDEQTMIVARSRLPAGTLDLRVGDELLALNSPRRPIATESDLMDALRGQLNEVSLTVLRGGDEVIVDGSWPAAAKVTERRGLWVSGALFAESELLTGGQVGGSPALMVHFIEPGSEADSAALQVIDLLVSANGQTVDSLAALATIASRAAEQEEPLELLLLRLASADRAELFVHQRRALPTTSVELVGPAVN